ncbi:hypothetical protein B0H34DRAFT_349869 [Crassisporium funariophilum]|nr:hypothetical protein B0H34DRAFT_349869 [Crassisporium funariophilum]
MSWSAPPPTYDAHSGPTSYMTTTLTPYLQLPHLLSLTWLAYPILSLIFVAFRLQLSLADAQSAVASAKDNLLTSCKAAEEAATSAASMPRYMALATNKQFAEAVNGSMNAARAALILSLTAMEAIINFIIDLYRSTLLCFLELVVRGGLAILIGAVQEINTVLQSVTSSLRTSIQSDIASANNVIRTAIDAINKVNPFGDITAPQIAVPSLDSLQNVSLPPAFQQALTNLNSSLPSVADIKNKVEDVINTPFELLKKDINDTFAGISFEVSGLPVPEQNRLTFCSDLDTSIVDDIGRDFIKTAKIGALILILLALLLIGLNCALTWYKWRCMKNHLEYTRQAWMSDPTMVHTKSQASSPQITLSDHNLMMLQANSEHPLITRITNQLSSRLRLTPSQHVNMQWFFNYIFHPPAIACFLIGFFGLLCVQVQLLAMGPLVSKYQDRAASTVSDFSTTIAESINRSMYNQSMLYANEVNGRVDAIQTTINDGVFGWVNGTTVTLNTTINEFYSDIQAAVATVFNGTILESPANEFLRCFIGSKVDAIENALTFLHDNLKVDMPRVDQAVLVLSPESVNEATAPIAAAAIGGGEGDDQGLLGRLINSYAESLKKERVMFGIFIALWGVVILMGVCVILWHSYGKTYLEKRGRKKWETEQRSGVEGIVVPFRGGAPTGNLGDEKVRSFSPLPSPRGSTFKPFWSSRSNSPANNQESASSSMETVTQKDADRPWNDIFAPTTTTVSAKQKQKKRTTKLLAIGRKAMGKEQLKKDGDDEESAVPLSPPAVIGSPMGETHDRNTAWYGRMTALLARKEPANSHSRSKSDTESVDFWDQSAMTHTEQRERDRPKLQIYTQKGLDKYGPPPRHAQQQPMQQSTRSRWSASPDATQTTWTNILSPTKLQKPSIVPPTPAVLVSQPEAPMSYQSHPPIAVPIVRRQNNSGIPLDVGPVYEDPLMTKHIPTPNALPIPLYNGFDSPQTQAPHQSRARIFASPPRHPQSHTHNSQSRRRQDSSPPPPLKSPRMWQPQHSLAPPPDRHRRSSSESRGSRTVSQQWRVTNATPGDHVNSSSSSLAPSYQGQRQADDDSEVSHTPVTRLLTTTHARQSSSVNPFITPFDDEHQVRIENSPAYMRKSMQTNPFAVAL